MKLSVCITRERNTRAEFVTSFNGKRFYLFSFTVARFGDRFYPVIEELKKQILDGNYTVEETRALFRRLC